MAGIIGHIHSVLDFDIFSVGSKFPKVEDHIFHMTCQVMLLVKDSLDNAGDPRDAGSISPWVGKIPWRRT